MAKKKISAWLSRLVTLVVVAAIVATGVYYAFLRGSSDKSASAEFPAAVGIYVGTPVKILGVNAGEVTSVKPHGASVTIKMTYSGSYRLAAKAQGIQVANSLVSDRYIEIGPLVKSGDHTSKVLKDGGRIAAGAAPAELDDIFGALSGVSKALGPQGANAGGQKSGALSALLRVSAANLKGNGAALGNSITQLSQAAQTLSGARGDLFQTVGNLRKFTDALNSSDGQIRLFNRQLAQVAGDLASERGDLGGALKQLGLALDSVNEFIKKNAGKFHTSITGLREITNILVKQRSSLNETLTLAPVALANITHAYQPDLGVIATRSNLASLTDPGQLCTALTAIPGIVNGVVPGNLLGLLGTITQPLVTACQTFLKAHPLPNPSGLDPTKLGSTLLGLLQSGNPTGLIATGGN